MNTDCASDILRQYGLKIRFVKYGLFIQDYWLKSSIIFKSDVLLTTAYYKEEM
jgi:hypothetical protein